MKQTGRDDKNHLRKVKDFHDVDASQYRTARYHCDTCEGLMYVTRKELVLAMMDGKSGNVLDIGCGPGILTKDLLDKNLKVYSADLSIEMIKQARQQAAQGPARAQGHFAVSDASHIPFSDGAMDTVLCIGLMCYMKDHKAVLSEIKRILKPSGTTIIQINNIQVPTLYRTFVPLYHFLKSKITGKSYDKLDFEFNFSSTEKFLEDLRDSHFQVIGMAYYDFRIPFIDIIFPRLSVKAGQFMFRKRHSRLSKCFANGLLIHGTTV